MAQLIGRIVTVTKLLKCRQVVLATLIIMLYLNITVMVAQILITRSQYTTDQMEIATIIIPAYTPAVRYQLNGQE